MTIIFGILVVVCIIGAIISGFGDPKSPGGVVLFIAGVALMGWSLFLNLGWGWAVVIFGIVTFAFGVLWRSSDKRKANKRAISLAVLAILVSGVGGGLVGYNAGKEAGDVAGFNSAMSQPMPAQYFEGEKVQMPDGTWVARPNGTGSVADRSDDWKVDLSNNATSDVIVGGIKGHTPEEQKDDLLPQLKHNPPALALYAKAADLPQMAGRDVNDIGWLIAASDDNTAPQYMSKEGRKLHADLVNFYNRKDVKLTNGTAPANGVNTGRNDAGIVQSNGISGDEASRKTLVATSADGTKVSVLLRCGNPNFVPGARMVPSGHTDSQPPRQQKAPPQGGGPAPEPVPVTVVTTQTLPPSTVTKVTTPPSQPPTTVTEVTTPSTTVTVTETTEPTTSPPSTSLSKVTTVAPEHEGNAPSALNTVTADPTASAPAVAESDAPTSVPTPDPPVVPTQPREVEPGPVEGGATSDNPVTGAPSADTCAVCGPAVGASPEAPAAPAPAPQAPAAVAPQAPAAGVSSGLDAAVSDSTAGNSGVMSQASEPAAPEQPIPVVESTSVVEKAFGKDENNDSAVAVLAALAFAMGFGALLTRRTKVTIQ